MTFPFFISSVASLPGKMRDLSLFLTLLSLHFQGGCVTFPFFISSVASLPGKMRDLSLFYLLCRFASREDA